MSLAQNDNITPQVFSPNAAELGKYGRVPVNYFNGLPNITIPLTEIRAKSYTLPIYLTYHASGNKPDQHPGWVGQGWTLHAGGCINRIIRGIKDEMTQEEFDANNLQSYENPGYLYHIDATQSTNWTHDLLHQKGLLITQEDYSPDEYQINIDDIHASFYLSGNGTVGIVSRSDVDFEVSYVMCDQTMVNRGVVVYTGQYVNTYAKTYRYIREFIITKTDGTRYHFGGAENAIEFSAVHKASFYEPYGDGSWSDYWDLTAVANTWMLTMIERPDGEKINFEYKREGVPVIFEDSHYSSFYYISYDSQYKIDSVTDDRRLNHQFFLLLPSYLKSIHCRYGTDSLSFHTSHSIQLDYDYTAADYEYRIGANVMPYDSLRSKSFHLQLDSIVTGRGIICLNYTSNPSTRLKLNDIQVQSEEEGIMCYEMRYNSTPLPRYNSRKTDLWGYYNTESSYNVLPFPTLDQRRSGVNASLLQAEMLTRIIWPTGGWTDFEYEPHDYSKVAGQFPFTLSSSSGQVGGLRIKKITDHSSFGTPVTRTIYYTDNGISSGILSGMPTCYTGGHHYVNEHYGEWIAPLVYNHLDIEYDAIYYCFSERELNLLSSTDGRHVTYSKVTEYSSNEGMTEYQYYNHDDPDLDCMDHKPTAVVEKLDNKILCNPFNSMELSRGLLKTKKKFDIEGKVIKIEGYHYSQDTTKSLCSTMIIKQFGGIFCRASYSKIFTFFPALTRKTVTTYPDGSGSPTVETTDYEWDSHRRLKRMITSVVGPANETVPSDTLVEERFYAADYEQSGFDGVDYPAMTALGMGGVPVEKVLSRDGKLVAAELTEWKYFPSSGCYLPFRRSTASPSEYAYTGGGLFRGRSRIMPYSRPENTILKYDASANPVEVYLSDGRYARYTWDAHSRLTGSFLGVKDDRMVQVDNYLEENVIEQHNLNNNAFPYYICGFETSSDSLCHVGFYFIEGGAVDLWCQLDTISFRYYGPGNPSPGMVAPSLSEDFLIPAGIHTLSLSTNSSSGTYNSPPQTTQPIDPEPSDGPDHPGWTEPAPGSTSAPIKGTLTLRYRGEVNHPYYEQWAQMRHFSFEGDVGDCQDGFESDCARIGSYTFSAKFDPSLSYVIDMQVKRNGAWEYDRQAFQLSGGNTYIISAGGLPFDEVRIYPVDAEVETYTWWPDGNLRSRTDGRGVTESFVYDAFGRLIEVRDTDGNRVEGYDYHYATHLDMVGL